MITLKDALEPPEEEFDLPTARIEKSNCFCRQIQEVRCQQESVIDILGAKGFLAGNP